MRLKELREEKNLTQLQIATAIKTSQSNIGRWENGLNEPAAGYLIKLANLFEVSVDYLLGVTEYEEKLQTNVPHPPVLKADEKELLNLYRQLSYEGKHRLIARAEVMLEDSDRQNKHRA